MARGTLLLWAACLALPGPARAAEPTRAAPLYALPADGAWVEYDWTATGPDGKELKGTLRISSVGTKTVGDAAHRWVEVRKEYKEGDETKREYRKLLVAEKAFAAAPTLRDHVPTVIGQDGSEAPALLSAARARDFLDLGLSGSDAVLKEVAARDKVTVPLGKYEARHVRARDKSGERAQEYHGWLTADVPFGCARFEMREGKGDGPVKTVFKATAARSGKGARAEVDESKAR
jgi:hypothetical protein